jgi:hypothetical protein
MEAAFSYEMFVTHPEDILCNKLEDHNFNSLCCKSLKCFRNLKYAFPSVIAALVMPFFLEKLYIQNMICHGNGRLMLFGHLLYDCFVILKGLTDI